MKGKNVLKALSVLNMFGCVGWLDETENIMVRSGNETSFPLQPTCCRTCGWTYCNPRCSLSHRNRQIYSASKFSECRVHDREIRKAG